MKIFLLLLLFMLSVLTGTASPSQDDAAMGTWTSKLMIADALAMKAVVTNTAFQAILKNGKRNGTHILKGYSSPLLLPRGAPDQEHPRLSRPPYHLVFYHIKTEEVTKKEGIPFHHTVKQHIPSYSRWRTMAAD